MLSNYSSFDVYTNLSTDGSTNDVEIFNKT